MNRSKIDLNAPRIEDIMIGVRKRLNTTFLMDHNITVDDIVESLSKDILATFECRIAGTKLKTIEVKHPYDWKESLKERFFPKWLKRKFPVKYKAHTLDTTIFLS